MPAPTPHHRTLVHLLGLLLLLSVAVACEDDPVLGAAGDDAGATSSNASNTTASSNQTDTGATSTGGTTGDPDTGTANPDTNAPTDTNDPTDTAVADTATMDDATADTAPPEDTTPPEDTAIADTAPPEDTAVADTAPPEDTGGAEVFVGAEDPYGEGELAVATIDIDEGDNDAPTTLRIYTPTQPGTYAVLVFQHGFILTLENYDQLLGRIASHGFVIVSPTMYDTGGLPFGTPTVAEEVEVAQTLRGWIDEELAGLAGVDVDLTRVGYIGHSRGGKVAWSMLVQDPTVAQAIAGVDPVDGTGGPPGQEGDEERVVMGMFDIDIPTLVIGSGLGPTGFIPCAPDGDNYVQFYEASPAPAWEVVATEYGHLDMLDDNCGLSCIACPRGDDPPVMRVLTAALLTAFFRASLQGDEEAYTLLTDAEAANTPIETRNR
ncbi:MAG: hypothetical protein CMH57_15985 [Myxococcales bacterium]|nr:hypothetical protein [Myxococcales bacterium]